MARHTRNVAGFKLRQISRAVYEQELPFLRLRWFVRHRVGKKKYCWRYTEIFDDDDTPKNESTKSFNTLTDAVIAANK